MRKYLEQSGLVYYSNRLRYYLTSKFSKIQNDIDSLSVKVDSNKDELDHNISDKTTLIKGIQEAIQETNTDINELDTKIDNLKTELYDKPTYPITSINNVNQYVYKNIKSGDVIEIPNNGKDTNYLIECYTQIDNDGAKPKDSILLKLSKTQVTIGIETIN